MLLAQVTVDLGYAAGVFKYLLAAALLAVAVFSFVLPLLRSVTVASATSTTPAAKPKVVLKRREVDRSSDTPPPAGFSEHLRIIETAAPNATPQVWWEYAKAEMTEAEVALAEAKMARLPANPSATA